MRALRFLLTVLLVCGCFQQANAGGTNSRVGYMPPLSHQEMSGYDASVGSGVCPTVHWDAKLSGRAGLPEVPRSSSTSSSRALAINGWNFRC